MSWGLAWKRVSDVFHLSLYYGTDETLDDQNRPPLLSSSSLSSSRPFPGPSSELFSSKDRFRIDLNWIASEDDGQVALRLQSKVMVALPLPRDTVVIKLSECDDNNEDGKLVCVGMEVVKQRDPLKAVAMSQVGGSGQQYDGMGVFSKLMKSDFAADHQSGNSGFGHGTGGIGARVCGDHWINVTVVSVYGCGLSMFPVELTKLPLLEKLYLDNNKLPGLPPEVGDLKNLKVLTVEHNLLVSVPVELRHCVGLVELSLEHNKLVCPLLDFRAMAELRVLRLFANPLEFLPEILPLHQLRHLSLANIRIVADDYLRSVNVQIEMENNSYFVASRHKLSAFFALVFRYSSCHHPLLASALAKMMHDEGNRVVIVKDENAVRQLISMISSENHHVVEQACSALTSLASDVVMALQLMKCDIMQPIQRVLKSAGSQELKSVLQVVAKLGFVSDIVAQKMLNRDLIRSLKLLSAHKDPEVQRSALVAIGNIAFCLENRRLLVASESLRDVLLRLAVSSELRVKKAAARTLAILGENESLRRCIKGRQVGKQGVRILTMDGGGMKGLATVQILKEIEKGTGKQIHEMFDLICGTSTGGMLAVALGIKLMSLEKCEDIYKNLGKLVFAEPIPKDNEAATWREKLDQLYKSSSQSYRVVVHGSKIDRISGIAAKYVGKPMLSYPNMSQNGPPRSLDLPIASFNSQPGMVDDMFGSNNLLRSVSGPSEADKPLIIELAVAAMEELVRMAQAGEPLWVPSPDNSAEILNEEEYSQAFPRGIGEKQLGMKSEASRDSVIVIMNHVNLVEILMDVNQWSNVFSGIVSRAMTLEVLSTGVAGNYNGALQVMTAEYQVPSPLVPTREYYFVRYCKQHADGSWAVVDVSLDNLRSSTMSRSRRRPSGCLIQELPNGYSKVTWVEHVEIDDRGVHDIYRLLVNSGLAFGASRWVATLDRQCERLVSAMANNIPTGEIGVISTLEGRKSMLKLSERMVLSFCSGVGASTTHTWTTLSGSGADDVRVMTRKSIDDPGRPPGIVLSAATSFWIPVPPKRVFDFLRNEDSRSEWDILSNGGLVQEMAHIANGRDPGNCVSLLRVNSANSSQGNMLILQESSSDSTGSYVIYAPVDIAAMNVVLSGGDPDYVALLPYGFAILPDGAGKHQGGSIPEVGNGGSLLTVAFQILVDSVPTAKLSLGSVATVNSLIKCTVERIKAAVGPDNP